MGWLWLIAVFLAIPTYGISLVVAFLIAIYVNQNSNYTSSDEVAMSAYIVANEYKKFLKKPTMLSDIEIAELNAKYMAMILDKLVLSGMDSKAKRALAAIEATYLVAKFHENYDEYTATRKALIELEEFYNKLRREGYLL